MLRIARAVEPRCEHNIILFLGRSYQRHTHGTSVGRYYRVFQRLEKNFVQPLRSVRNSLKREINNYPSTEDFETLRKRVKNDELAAEQIQQEIIQSKIETRDLKFQPFSRSDAMKHLAYYLAEEGIVLTDALKNKLDEIAKNVSLM